MTAAEVAAKFGWEEVEPSLYQVAPNVRASQITDDLLDSHDFMRGLITFVLTDSKCNKIAKSVASLYAINHCGQPFINEIIEKLKADAEDN